jgi:exodeoxyribonuclease VII large subunit
MVSASRADLLARLGELSLRSAREARRRIEYSAQALDALARRLVHPADRLRGSRQLVEQFGARLCLAAARQLEAGRYRLREAPVRLANAMARRIEGASARVDRLRASLSGLDPVAVLERGYSITRRADGEVVRDARRVAPGERLHTTLARGWVESEAKKTG